MTDYRTLSIVEKAKIDKEIIENIPAENCHNENSGFSWVEPDYTLEQVHNGNNCAVCWNIYYNCLCSHES